MKTIYRFGYTTEGDKSMSDTLGGKGANLAEMSNLGLPVPYGITIPTDVCQEYRSLSYDEQLGFVEALVADDVLPALTEIEEELGYEPLYSVRSGAKFSMPGMMDTLLNVGLTTENKEFWADRLGRLAMLDCRCRQHQMFCETVGGVEAKKYDQIWKKAPTVLYGTKEKPGTITKVKKSLAHMKKVVEGHEYWFSEMTGSPLPDTLAGQLVQSIKAVFESWDSERAVAYREMHDIPHSLGTAVNIQMMVFGNMNDESASGVAFTRDPSDGYNELTGEYLVNAQGEDVVAGTVTPMSLAECGDKWLEELCIIANKLEGHYRDMLDLEFTVEDGKLWMLQCRVAKRSAKAAFKVAHDLAINCTISKQEAVERVTYKQYMALKKVRVDMEEVPEADFTGIEAGGGLVIGRVVTTADEAINTASAGTAVILVTDETTPNDFKGMAASVGILTRTGGKTSHAAVVGRGLDKSCVVGVTDLPQLQGFPQEITIDGETGRVWLKPLPLTVGDVPDYAKEVVKWGISDKKGQMVMKVMPGDDFELKSYVMMGVTATKDEAAENLSKAESYGFEELYIDFSTVGEHKLDEDVALWNICGTGTTPEADNAALITDRYHALIESDSDILRKAAVIILASSDNPDWEEALTVDGWKVVRRVQSLEDLLESDGIVDFDEGFAAAVGGEHVAEKLFLLMKDAGKPVLKKPEPVSQARLVFEALK